MLADAFAYQINLVQARGGAGLFKAFAYFTTFDAYSAQLPLPPGLMLPWHK
jgi:hypothetical protein